MSSEQSVVLREPTPKDINFVFSSWLKSFRGSNFAKNITNTIYFYRHHKVIENLLQHSKVVIACNKDDRSQILGYMVGTKIDGVFTLHYAYVKHTYRRLGVGKLMLSAFNHDPSVLSCYTHDTHMASKLAAKFNFSYHPYLMMTETESGAFDEPTEES